MHLIDRAQGVDPATLTHKQRSANRADLMELLDDPECQLLPRRRRWSIRCAVRDISPARIAR